MKKAVIGILGFILLILGCTSTLQEDIFDSTEQNMQVLEAISEFEDQFIIYDAQFALNTKISNSQLLDFHNSIETKLSQTHEPAILARLQAIDGILYLMENKSKKAQDCYKEAKASQASDSFVLLLEIRLEKDSQASLNRIQEILNIDKSNAIITLEKGIVLANLNQYDKAIAAIDDSFLLFDNLDKTKYRELYAPFRENLWKLYSSEISDTSITSVKTSDLAKPLTKEVMILLTKDNSTLLNDFLTDSKKSTNEITKKLTAYGVLSSALDKTNQENSAAKILNSNAISRIMAARFIWNLYVEKKGKPELRTRYSSRYAKMPNPVSPIADVAIDCEDLDAVIGVVENEIMNLPDGKAFYPDDILTGLDYLSIIKQADK